MTIMFEHLGYLEFLDHTLSKVNYTLDPVNQGIPYFVNTLLFTLISHWKSKAS